MSKVLVASINQIATEKDLDKEVIFDAIEAALVSAYKRNYGAMANVSAKVDRLTGDMRVFADREVVEDVMNVRTEVAFIDARKFAPLAQLGDVIQVESKPDDFGRIAAQTAKQVILQRIREAERDTVFENFAHKVNEVLTAQVRSIDAQSGAITLVLDDKHEVLLLREEQIATEKLRRGDFVKVYVVDVHKSPRGPMIKLSRTHRNLLRRLMEMEIPEVRDGIVEIKSISREPGQRSKAAVVATRPNVDPVGSCVGPRGLRIQNIVSELAGEKIDVVEWSSDPASYISNALSPAKISYVLPDEKSSIKTAVVVVPDKQLSLAIGKEGQNARLAAKLTGWRIDIKSETEATSEGLDATMAERVQRGKTSDLLSFAEQLLKNTQPATEDRFLQAARSLQQQEGLPSEVSEPLDFEDDESKSSRKVKKARTKGDTAEEGSLVHDTSALAETSTADLDAIFQRGLEAMSVPIAPARPSENLFGDALAAINKEGQLPSFSEPLPEMLSDESIRESSNESLSPATKTTEEELPQVITAAMLRERMAQRKQQNLGTIEIPQELLAGYGGPIDTSKDDDDRNKVVKKAGASAKAADKKPKKKKWRPADSGDEYEDIY